MNKGLQRADSWNLRGGSDKKKLNVAFLCGTLEPGFDGVGDYTRKLGALLAKKGHVVTIIALNDSFIKENSKVETQAYDDSLLEVLRIGRDSSDNMRFQLLDSWIKEHEPELISLQYVPFSFHKKGLPWRLSNVLKRIGSGRRWHIMFHELWVGLAENAPKKEILWGLLQKKIIQRTIKALSPQVIHTQSKIYQEELVKLGNHVCYLPLFSNIPRKKIQFVEKLDNQLSFVLFGSIHPYAPINEFAKELAVYTRQKKMKTKVTIAGRSGPEKESWMKVFNSFGIAVVDRGQLEEEEISNLLCEASYGITTTPAPLADKSGTVAAMRLHELPVICVSKTWQRRNSVKNMPLINGVVEYKVGNLQNCLDSEMIYIPQSDGDVAQCFVSDIINTSTP